LSAPLLYIPAVIPVYPRSASTCGWPGNCLSGLPCCLTCLPRFSRLRKTILSFWKAVRVGTVITGLGDVRCKRCSVSFGGGLTRVENLVGEQIRTRGTTNKSCRCFVNPVVNSPKNTGRGRFAANFFLWCIETSIYAHKWQPNPIQFVLS
jgi:hypothetical protein